jgi:hypothetical protein
LTEHKRKAAIHAETNFNHGCPFGFLKNEKYLDIHGRPEMLKADIEIQSTPHTSSIPTLQSRLKSAGSTLCSH